MVKTALIDSNIQGFAYMHALLQSHPDLEYVYFHDSEINALNEPEKLLRRIKKDIRFLLSKGVRRIILIDQKVCSLILKELQAAFSEIEFIDLLSLIVKKIASQDKRKILIFADEQTILQCRYKQELKSLDPDFVVGQKSCSPLEKMINEVNDPFFIQNYLESALFSLRGRSDLAILANSAYTIYKRMFESILKCPVYVGDDLLDPSMFEKASFSPQQYCFSTADPNRMRFEIKSCFEQEPIIEAAVFE